MKPVKIEIQAMGPYKNKEVIDFSNLGEKKFFLIHGPTGSGKTSILDAMTYALYGDTSGDERSLEQMRSQWADGDTESHVIFEFYIGGKLYRIKRSPRQTLNKKRGSGTREVNPEAALWLIGENDDVVETGTSKVTERIEALLGFNSSQFRQVIVLPQGKFRELLAAKAEGREEILKVLFATERFTRIQEIFRDRAADVKRRLDTLYSERDAVLRGENAESADELSVKASACKIEAAGFSKAFKKLESEEKKLREEMTSATVADARFKEVDLAAEELKALEGRESEINGYAETLEAGRRAGALADIYKSLTDERSAFSGEEAKFSRCREEFASAEKKKNETEKAVKDTPGKKEELKLAEKKLYRLESCRDLYSEIAKADEEIALNEKIKKESAKLYTADVEKRSKLEDQVKSLRLKVSEAEVAAAGLTAINLSLERITLSGKKIAEIEKSGSEILKLESEIPSLEKKHAALLIQIEKLNEDRANLEEQWRMGQASMLASELKSGEPCPVCGSLHHPAPAAGDKDNPGTDDIEKLKAEEKKTDDEARSVEKEIIKKRTALESIRSQMPALEEIPEEHRNLTREDLKKRYREESAELERITLIAAGADSLKTGLADCENQLLAINTEVDRSSAALKEVELKLSALMSRRSQLGTGLPEGINNLDDLLAKIVSLKKGMEEIISFIADCEKEWKDASEKYSAAEALYRKLDEDCIAARVKLKEKELEFSSRLLKEGFKSEPDFISLMLGTEKFKDLEAVVEKYRRELISAKGRVERASAVVKDTERPDIAAISGKIDAVKNETEQIIGSMKGSESEALRLEKIAEKIRLIDQSALLEEQSFGVIQKLADVAGGKNSRKLTFQRYVLQSLFEEVLMIASNRLERMSRGRYRLISPGRLEDRRTSGGLDLEVFDEYTGYSRPVVTLSGGEAFLASLSLALGLADLVQQYAGGIHLDTVFIDEGFGSLDSETLDLAISTLIDLQSSGRLVGIISHVNELKERIDARLEVIPAVCGSTTRFVV
jgi:exonuclease SbcC